VARYSQKIFTPNKWEVASVWACVCRIRLFV